MGFGQIAFMFTSSTRCVFASMSRYVPLHCDTTNDDDGRRRRRRCCRRHRGNGGDGGCCVFSLRASVFFLLSPSGLHQSIHVLSIF